MENGLSKTNISNENIINIDNSNYMNNIEMKDNKK